MTRRLLLGAFLFHPGGSHVSGWRHRTAEPHRHVDIDYYARFAETAERGVFDTIFLADGLYLWDRFPSGVDHYGQTRLEPLTLLSALAVRTSRIGLAATISTTYNEPFHVARAIASLDHISRGRAAWNLVTSRYDEEARNFGGDDHLDHSLRYERGEEFVRVVQQLWDSWADDAILADRESGLFADAKKLHVADHRGTHFTVRGPLNVTRPPQGYPVLFQAGGSAAGQELAAATADAVFARPLPLADAQAFYAGLKERVVAHGRRPEDVAILPSLRPVVAETERDARELAEEILASTPPAIIVEDVAHSIGQTLPADPDAAIAFVPDTDIANESQSPNRRVARLLSGERLTPRDLYAESFWESVSVGTATSIADDVQERFESGAADGFVVQALTQPYGFESFVDLVVPELQRRGLTRTAYEETTLRERLGLTRPARVTPTVVSA
ncbi:NtaA/DmoA family FMN-dependent monooxygenase [Microbacterium trichothecenolyticum]|uniref:NtaA/DmoA family FMN-dependent monooxygenase n=1 Tax=Microbacterium ureisolvens TaxID=2781186 RepID=A0ABS7HUD9_9MICO|nr:MULTISPECIES: NtaA/DmoA family FMN-dependent monooxygenase [Microbacterium]MBW9108967.1 NtaA/DmoA family FMN-dependent monooxygenase [Microbacterium ureisolvens]MBW9119909.1 NtaA/DmoA family FMN-dependent monooxygenase [Microbacterium trichothecenolyticum]